MFHQSSKQILLGVVVALFLTMPAYAVKNVKVSNFGNGHQIWFQAEDYDERNPDTNAYYPVVDSGRRVRQGHHPDRRRRRHDSLDVRHQRRRRQGRHLVLLGTGHQS